MQQPYIDNYFKPFLSPSYFQFHNQAKNFNSAFEPISLLPKTLLNRHLKYLLLKPSPSSTYLNYRPNKILILFYISFTNLAVSVFDSFTLSDFFRKDNLAGPRQAKRLLCLFFFFPFALFVSSLDDSTSPSFFSSSSSSSSETAGYSSLEAPSGSRDLRGILSWDARSRLESKRLCQGSKLALESRNSSCSAGFNSCTLRRKTRNQDF